MSLILYCLPSTSSIKILLLFICTFSCDVLDEDPFVQTDTENYYQNEEDAIDALTAAYARLKSGNGYYKQKFLSTLFAASDQGLATFEFNNFKEAFSVMTRIAFEAEAQQHHPEWTNVYNELSITLSTHDAGGVTEKDIEMAKTIEDIIDAD